MKRFKLQEFGDGFIYRNVNKTYTIEISHGSATGSSVEECLKILAKKITTVPEVKPIKLKSSVKKFY